MTPSAMTSAGRKVVAARSGSGAATARSAAPTATARAGASSARAAAAQPRPVRAGATAPRPVRAPGARATATARSAVARPSRGSGAHAPRPARSAPRQAPRRVSGPVKSPRPTPAAPLPRRLALGTIEFVRTLPDHRLLDRLVRGRAWIPVLGVLLAGIVATQVEVLKLGASMGRWMERSAALTSHNQALQASVATLSDDQRIERLAAQMGMVMPAPTAITFVSRRPAGGARAAVGRIHAADPTQFLASLQADAALSASAPVTATPTTTSASSGLTLAPAGSATSASTGTTASAGATPVPTAPSGSTSQTSGG